MSLLKQQHREILFRMRPFFCGALCAFAQPSLGLWPLMFFGAALFYFDLWQISQTDKNLGKLPIKTAFGKGWLFGFGYFLAGLYWISNALLVEGNDYIWAWPLALIGIPCLLSFFTAFSVVLGTRWAMFGNLRSFVAFIVSFFLFEWLRGHAFTGFPWNLYGYIWNSSLPLAQNASWLGIYGLSFITIFWVFLPGWLMITQNTRLKYTLAALAITSFIAMAAWGTYRLSSNPITYNNDIQIKLVQANIPQAEKWNPSYTAINLHKHLDLSKALPQDSDKTTIIVWPETALADYVFKHPKAKAEIKAVLAEYRSPVYLVTGYIQVEEKVDGSRAYKNSLIVIDQALNIIMSYDKHHLVPFGEYIPFQDKIPLAPVTNFTGLTKGTPPSEIALGSSTIAHIIPLVCYEIIFPNLLKNAYKGEAIAAINVTNDSWYGNSSGPYQHLAKSRFRAIENNITVIRAANTGISAIIDPYGRIISMIALNETNAATQDLPVKP